LTVLIAAAETTRPRPLLFACPGEEKYRTKTGEILGWHPVETLLHFGALGRVEEVRCKWCQWDDARKCRQRG
jgi:hypothetical protein